MYQKIPIANNITGVSTHKTKKKILVFVGSILLLFCCMLVYILYVCTPIPLHDGGVKLEVQKGMTTKDIVIAAQQAGIVRSQLFLYMVLLYAHNPSGIYAGIYSFEGNQTPFTVAEKLAKNSIDKSELRITIPEGSTRKDIASIVTTLIPSFDTSVFMSNTEDKEGFLFPDTYFVATDFSSEKLITLLTNTYTEKIKATYGTLQTETLTEKEIITLASILEKEANDETSMKMVSGILQNRLQNGIALQTDATVGYVLNKPLSELSDTDLEIDTPYNTYLYKGLPPTPIGNPGLRAIDAVLHPTHTDNMFYITGQDGTFYYAKTFQEHKQNIAKHL